MALLLKLSVVEALKTVSGSKKSKPERHNL